jgi:hypothetical protein
MQGFPINPSAWASTRQGNLQCLLLDVRTIQGCDVQGEGKMNRGCKKMKLVKGGDKNDSCGGTSLAEPEPAARRWQAQPQLRFLPRFASSLNHMSLVLPHRSICCWQDDVSRFRISDSTTPSRGRALSVKEIALS